MKPITEYSWIFLDGLYDTVQVGEEGFAESDLSLLLLLDRQEANESRRYRRHNVRLEAVAPYGGESTLMINAQTDFENDTLDKLERLYIHKRLLQGLADLSEPQRRLLSQVFVEGLSLREIARREGVSDNAIRKRLKVILKKLKRNFP